MSDTCSICGTTARPVRSYRIYYGKKGASAAANFALNTRTTTKYTINPEPLTISLCDSCINKERSSKRFFGVLLMGLGLFLGWLFYSNASLGITAIILMLCALFFFGGVGYLKFFVAREPDREQIAIMLAKKQVAQSGFDTFLTEAKYKSMYRLPGVSQKTADTEADEIGSLIRTIKAYGLNEVHFLDGSANQALVAARRLALIGRDEPRVIVALSNLLPELKRQRSAFRNLAAQMEADNLISIIFDIVTKNAMKPN